MQNRQKKNILRGGYNMDYITNKINKIDAIIRKNNNIPEAEKSEILNDLQLIHATIKSMIEAAKEATDEKQ